MQVLQKLDIHISLVIVIRDSSWIPNSKKEAGNPSGETSSGSFSPFPPKPSSGNTIVVLTTLSVICFFLVLFWELNKNNGSFQEMIIKMKQQWGFVFIFQITIHKNKWFKRGLLGSIDRMKRMIIKWILFWTDLIKENYLLKERKTISANFWTLFDYFFYRLAKFLILPKTY